MTAATAVADELVAAGLRGDLRDDVAESHLGGEAAHRRSVSSRWSVSTRVHHATVLSVIVGAQLAWLAGLGYAVYAFLT